MLSTVQILISVALLSPVILALSRTEGDDGIPARAGEFPYHVYVRQKLFTTISQCSGAIISPNFVLTVARCDAYPDRFPVGVVVGALKHQTGHEDSSNHVISYGAKRIIRHEHYSENRLTSNPSITSRNDIALIETRVPIEFNELVAPIALQPSFIDRGVQVVHTGYVDERDQYTHLTFFTRKTLSNEKCHEIWENANQTVPVSEDLVCATLNNNGRTRCSKKGDPLIANKQLIGVASLETDPCGYGKPIAFTRVSTHIDWINKHTNLSF